jgi:hypothetical protein
MKFFVIQEILLTINIQSFMCSPTFHIPCKNRMTKINMQLRKDFTQKQAEPGGSFDAPPIPFIPEESLLGDMETHELPLLIDPQSMGQSVGSAKNNTYKLKGRMFQCGLTKDLLVWLDKLDTIFCNKRCTQADSKFNIAQLLIFGDARTSWCGMANAEKLKKDPNDLAGVKTIGATEESYKATMNLWLKATDHLDKVCFTKYFL